MDRGAWWAAVHGVTKSRTRLGDFTFTFHALGKEMATHSSVLAWRIPGTEEPGGLPPMGSHRVGHDCSNLILQKRFLFCLLIFFFPLQTTFMNVINIAYVSICRLYLLISIHVTISIHILLFIQLIQIHLKSNFEERAR